jgi:ribosomal protein S13
LQDIIYKTTKRVDIALTYIYGIGRKNVVDILKKAEVEDSKRVKSLIRRRTKENSEGFGRIQIGGRFEGGSIWRYQKIKRNWFLQRFTT